MGEKKANQPLDLHSPSGGERLPKEKEGRSGTEENPGRGKKDSSQKKKRLRRGTGWGGIIGSSREGRFSVGGTNHLYAKVILQHSKKKRMLGKHFAGGLLHINRREVYQSAPGRPKAHASITLGRSMN